MRVPTCFALSRRGPQRGVVLPIVLVVMMIVTTLVITHVRRGTVDERLAGNWSRLISNQTVADTVVRYCELVVLSKEMYGWDTLLPSAPFNVNGTAAWKSNLAPNQIKTIPLADLPAGASGGTCIIENATSELELNRNQTGNSSQNSGSGIEPNMRKYRFTAAVTFPDSTAFGAVTFRSQSEVRWMIR